MKKLFYIFVITILTAVILPSCSSENVSDANNDNFKDTTAAKLPDYTVMLYGCGGGNLDGYFAQNVKQCVWHGKTDNLNMTFLFKMSKKLKDSVDVGTMKGAARFVLGEKKDTTGFNIYNYPAETIGGDDYPLYKSETLTDFIKWNVENYPAKNYILVMWNHGGGWLPTNDTLTVSRSSIYDDNVGRKSLSLEQFTLGVKNSGVHLKAIYSDACMMGLYENLCDYATVADYFIGAVETTPGLGARYDWLLDAIAGSHSSDDKLWDNVKSFSDKICDYWVTNCPLDPLYQQHEEMSDMGIINLKKIDSACSVIKQISEELVSTDSLYHDAYMSAQADTIQTGWRFYDTKSYFANLAKESGNERLKQLSTQYNSVLDDILYRRVVHPDYEEVPRSITIGCFIADNTYYKKMKMQNSYEYLLFDQATKWSNWLKLR